MAVHNPNENYFLLCLDSIKDQTYKDYEVIIVDDGTASLNIDDILAAYDFEYKIIRNVQNIGLARSLNVGIKYCSGEYIARMDDDDIMDRRRLEMQLACAAEGNDVIFSNIALIDDDHTVSALTLGLVQSAEQFAQSIAYFVQATFFPSQSFPTHLHSDS